MTASCLFSENSLNGQRFQTLNDQFPLEQARVFLQDRFGFLWIGTNDGLIRYDGYSIKTYSPDPEDSTSLAGPEVISLAEDRTGRIWVGMDHHGLQIFDRNTERFEHVCLTIEEGICRDPETVTTIAPTRDHVWVGTRRGLCRMNLTDPNHQRWYEADSTNPRTLSHSYIFNLSIDRDSNLWIGTNDGINRLETDGGFVNYYNDENYLRGEINGIGQDSQGTIWVAPREERFRLYSFDSANDRFIGEPLFDSEVTKMSDLRFTLGQDDDLWLHIRGSGAMWYHPYDKTSKYFEPQKGKLHGFRSYYQYPAFVDKFGNFWSGGVLVHKWPSSMKAIQSLSSDGYSVTSVFANDRYIWMNDQIPFRWNLDLQERDTHTYGSGLSPIESSGQESAIIYQYDEAEDGRISFTMTRFAEERIGNTKHFVMRDPSTGWQKIYHLPYGGPLRDFEWVSNDQVWIAGNQGSPIFLDVSTGKYGTLLDFNVRDIVNVVTVTRDRQGYLWWGNSSGILYRHNPANHQVLTFPNGSIRSDSSLTGYSISDILVHSDGSIWIATDYGLNRLDPELFTFTFYGSENGLCNEYVTSIIEGENGDIWLGTRTALARFALEQEAFTCYTQSDGLINSTFGLRVVAKDKEGTLYFGGRHGVDFFHPDQMGTNSIPPNILIEEVRVDNDVFKSDIAFEQLESIELEHNRNFVEIKLLALHFTAPPENQYAFQINDGQWFMLGTNRTVTLADLSPGHYNLSVRAANADDVWCAPKQLLSLTIIPPWWQSGWFYLILVLTLSLLAVAGFRLRLRQIRLAHERQAAFNKKVAEIELKALRAQMNPHFIFNSLNSVKSLVNKDQKNQALHYLSQFSQLIRLVLNNSRQKFVRLQDEVYSLQYYLELERLRLKNFDYNIQVADEIQTDFIRIPPLIIQPYVENAIWHGIRHKKDHDGHIDLGISREGPLILIIIEDNGIGRKLAHTINVKSGEKQISLGMQITEDRLSFLQEIYGAQATIRIKDLQDPTGTRVEIRLPISE